MRQLTLSALAAFPMIHPGDNPGEIILHSLKENQITLQENDLLVIAQKIISKAENRLINLEDVIPSSEALHYASLTEKDPRLVELILQESTKVIRWRLNLLVVEHKLGFICANAGIDQSNVTGNSVNSTAWALLLPQNPDQSAQRLREYIQKESGVSIGVLIIDSHGRAWRNGIAGISIGIAGLPGVVDLRGEEDLNGYCLKATQIAAADELAAGASLIMGQANEGTPVVHVRGFPYPLREGCLRELIRPENEDLFR